MNTRSRRIVPFFLVVTVIVLLNVASTTLFVRADLTRNDVFSLSAASRDAVASLEEPLTIKAFFSSTLPSPYNNNRQILRDLLDEYAIAGNRYFNYDIVTVPSRQDAQGEMSPEEQEARQYRIFPIQIQNVQQDEVQLVTVYMGVAIIHGDMIETIPAVTSTANLEYRITSIIDKMSDKISALLAMRENIDVTLVLTENLEAFSGAFHTLPDELKNTVAELNTEFYGRLTFERIDPTNDETDDVQEKYGAVPLVLRTEDGGREQAYAALAISRGERKYTVDIISRGIFGLQIADVSSLKETISSVADSLIGVQQEIGYVTGYGAPPLAGGRRQPGASPLETDLANFNTVVSSEYRFREIDLDTGKIPDGLSTLVIVAPREKLSDFALYQIDQFLLGGNNVVMFLDSHTVLTPQDSQFGGRQPVYLPRTTGLEKLVRHYGLELEQAYVLDEKSFVQRQRSAQGGIMETPVYFAPIVDAGGRNTRLKFLKGIPDMVLLNASPVRPVESDDDDGPGARATLLFKSSKDGWLMKGNEINLTNPYVINPPPDDMQEVIPLAYMLTGPFESYFVGREIPDPPEPKPEQESDDRTAGTETSALRADAIDLQRTRIDSGNGRLVLIGGSAMIGSNVIDAEAKTGNAAFVLNLLDYLSGREDYAAMRTKGAGFAPLDETTVSLRSFVKTFNIAVLPIMVILAGLGVWFFRSARKRTIEAHFARAGEGTNNE